MANFITYKVQYLVNPYSNYSSFPAYLNLIRSINVLVISKSHAHFLMELSVDDLMYTYTNPVYTCNHQVNRKALLKVALYQKVQNLKKCATCTVPR